MESNIESSPSPLARVPRLTEALRVRKREPFAYNSKTFCVLEFNDAGMSILRLVDGQRSVLDIARCLGGDAPESSIEAIASKCNALLCECEIHGAIDWSQAGETRLPSASKQVP